MLTLERSCSAPSALPPSPRKRHFTLCNLRLECDESAWDLLGSLLPFSMLPRLRDRYGILTKRAEWECYQDVAWQLRRDLAVAKAQSDALEAELHRAEKRREQLESLTEKVGDLGRAWVVRFVINGFCR